MESTADLIEANRSFDQIYPTMKSTLSDSISLSVFCLPTSGLNPSSSYTTSTGMPPILRSMWSSASSNELRMSLPMTATGPLNVLMNPILMDFCWADAGTAASSKAVLAAKRALRIWDPPLGSLARVLLDTLMYRQRRQCVHRVTVAWGRRIGTSDGGRRMGDVGWGTSRGASSGGPRKMAINCSSLAMRHRPLTMAAGARQCIGRPIAGPRIEGSSTF